MDLQTPLTQIPGIGSVFKSRLDILGLSTVEDLIQYYPFRYDDFSKVSKISDLKVGETVTLKGEVWSIKNQYTKFRKVLTRATLNDGTASIELVWFYQSWLEKNIKTGEIIQVSGKVEKSGSKITLVSPVWDKIINNSNVSLNTGRLVPIYSETAGISSKWLRLKIAQVLPIILKKITDPLPAEIKGSMVSLTEALQQIHFPDSLEKVKVARKRLAFDEVFYLQLATLKKRQQWQKKSSFGAFKIDQTKLTAFIAKLPFNLTPAQEKVIGEIIQDLKKDYPMNRLVQGEVGSGKTVVAAAIIYLAYLNGFRSLMMAPTEILAFQHHQTLSKLFNPLGIEVGIYTGSRKFNQINDKRLKIKESKSELKLINHPSLILNQNSNPSIIVGTHALLSEKLVTENVGLVVVDEQQRFGVAQRGFLRSRAKAPHFLTMTATPIPRTIALTLYGDLDLSVIDQLPKERKIVKTYYVPQNKRADAYKFIATEVKKGFQVYIITPLIEESETLISVKAAKVEFEKLQKDIFPQFKLGLLHGKLKSKDKEAVINDFKSHKIDILISTTVVEVGVDVPNATIMLIEGAERFGLAQLHQLRGRVGRGSDQSYAFLFTQEENPIAVKRLKNLETIHNGLKLSELDLQIRGSGELFGIRQSGYQDLKIADYSDLELIETAKTAAVKILSDNPALDKYPGLASKLSDLGKFVMPD